MSCPDPYRPYDALHAAASREAELKVHTLPSDSEVQGLTSALVASGGGASSQDLALDLVLNRIVEQACLATGATGAAIALTRDGEMVCRATTGRNAPDLGVRLDNAGFSAECLRVGTLQRSDDTETDPRVDATACRLLGVRSILVIPLWYWGEFMGIFEIFSPRSNAFGERDEQTLQALAYRIVRHTKQATGSIAGFSATGAEVPTSVPKIVQPALRPDSEPEPSRASVLPVPVFELTSADRPAPAPRDMWTTVLAAVAVVIAGLIVGLMVWRVGWGGTAAKQSAAFPQIAQASPRPVAPSSVDTSAPTVRQETLELGSVASRPKISVPARNIPVTAAKKEALPSATRGGLAIYDEKGKLIYGTPIADPDQSVAKQAKPKPQPATAKQLAKATSPKATAPRPSTAQFVQLSPDIADDLLVDRIEPDYPDAARRARIQGSVTMEALIGADGKVQRVSPVSGNLQLADAATAAVRQWRYKPYSVDGRKVPVRTQVTVNFALAR